MKKLFGIAIALSLLALSASAHAWCPCKRAIKAKLKEIQKKCDDQQKDGIVQNCGHNTRAEAIRFLTKWYYESDGVILVCDLQNRKKRVSRFWRKIMRQYLAMAAGLQSKWSSDATQKRSWKKESVRQFAHAWKLVRRKSVRKKLKQWWANFWRN